MKRVLAVIFIVFSMFLYAQDEIVKAEILTPTNDIESGSSTAMKLILKIKDGWHINSAETLDKYSKPTKISLISDNGFIMNDIHYPEGELKSLSWGGELSLYKGELHIPFTMLTDDNIRAGKHELEFSVFYQACNDLTCMSPETITITLPVNVKVSEIQADTLIEKAVAIIQSENPVADSKPEMKTETQTEIRQDIVEESNPFQNKSMFLVLLIVFIMGLALNLTPCVYPLIPITMGYFLAQKESKSPVLLAIMYVLGLAITYSIIGTLAAFGGSMMGSLLAHPITLILFSVLMLALSLSMFGLYEFKLPNSLTQVGGGSRNGAIGALIMGLTMGIVAAPCVGPFVVSLLSFIAQKGSVFVGFITFFILALGLGVPYLFLGIFSTRIKDLPRSGEWLNGVRIFFGLALIGMAIYFVLPLIPGTFGDMILPVYMIIAAVYYSMIDKSGISIAWFARIKVIIAMTILAIGILMIKPAPCEGTEITWETYSAPVLESSIIEKEPVIIDFYADWCNPCKELEHITFADPDIQDILKDFTRLKVDLTVVNDSTNALKKEFDIPGVPTIIFYDKTGTERKDLRLNGFEKPKAFMNRLKKIISE